jgi:hypothetical protein
MEQLELFPNDYVRFATEFPREKLNIIREDKPEEYYRIMQIRNVISKHRYAVRQLDKRLTWDLERLM